MPVGRGVHSPLFFRAIVDVDVDPLMRAKLERVQNARG